MLSNAFRVGPGLGGLAARLSIGTTLAKPPTLPPPTIISAFEANPNEFSKNGSGENFVLDPTPGRRVQGQYALKMRGNGNAGGPHATKNLGPIDPSTLGMVALFINTRSKQTLAAVSVTFSKNGGTSWTDTSLGVSAAAKLFGSQTPDGGYWHAFDVSQVPSIMALAGQPGDCLIRISLHQNAPNASDVTVDLFMGGAKGKGGFIFTADDSDATAMSFFALLDEYGMKGTAYEVKNFVDGGTVNGRLRQTSAQVQSLYDRGHAICTGGDPGDVDLTTSGSLINARAKCRETRDWIRAKGWARDGSENDLVYSNGNFSVYAAQISAGTMTATGSTSVTVTATTGLAVGMFLVAGGVPEGTTIVAISGTTLTLSNAIASNGAGVAARAIDGRGEFYGTKLPDFLAADGFTSGRATQYISNSGAIYDRYGNPMLMCLPADPMGALNDAGWDRRIALAELGFMVVLYVHGYEPGGSGLNTNALVAEPKIRIIGQKFQAGVLAVETIPRNRARVIAAAQAVPA